MRGYGFHKKYLIRLYWWITHTHTHRPHVRFFKRSGVCYFTHLHPNLPVNHRNISTHMKMWIVAGLQTRVSRKEVSRPILHLLEEI